MSFIIRTFCKLYAYFITTEEELSFFRLETSYLHIFKSESKSVNLFLSLLSANCDKDIKNYMKDNCCRRQYLINHFGFHASQTIMGSHKCCDVCAANCKCGEDNCQDKWTPHDENDDLPEPRIGLSSDTPDHQQRNVSKEKMKTFQVKLINFHKELAIQNETKTMVSCPNVLFEFNSFHINQVLRNCHRLFSLKDILDHVEIWRTKYATAILQILSDTFDDVSKELPLNDSSNHFSQDFSICSDWEQIRDESGITCLLDTQDLEGVISFSDTYENNTRESLTH